jgi:hypothetical protein
MDEAKHFLFALGGTQVHGSSHVKNGTRGMEATDPSIRQYRTLVWYCFLVLECSRI